MGAMVSGVSLMENVSRMALELRKADEAASIYQPEASAESSEAIYTLEGRCVTNETTFPKGIYVVRSAKSKGQGKSGRKVIIR